MTASKWSQKHRASCERAEDAYTAAKPVSLRGSNAPSSHLCISFQQKRNKWSGVSCECTRIAGSGTTVYQCCKWSQSVQDCASFLSSSRNSNKTATRSSPPRLETQHCGHEQKQKRKFGQKGRLNVRSTAQKKNDVCNYRKMSRERIYPQYGFN